MGAARGAAHVRVERRSPGRAHALVRGRAPQVMLDQGYTEVDAPGPDVAVVLHFVDPDAAAPYRRKNAPTFVVALAELDDPPVDMLRTGYPLLVRGLANLCVMVSPSARPARSPSS